MAHFYGEMAGQRGVVSRLGNIGSGLETIAASWSGAVQVHLWHDEETGVDMARVQLIPWPHSDEGVRKVLYIGPVDGGDNGSDESA